jgi:hypothetical protein
MTRLRLCQRARPPLVIRSAHGIHAVLASGRNLLVGNDHVRAVAKLHDVVEVLRIRRVHEARHVGVVPVVRLPVGVRLIALRHRRQDLA